LTVDEATFAQSAYERWYELWKDRSRRICTQEPDYRCGQLLRLRRKRSRKCRAAEKRKEFSAMHVPPHENRAP